MDDISRGYAAHAAAEEQAAQERLDAESAMSVPPVVEEQPEQQQQPTGAIDNPVGQWMEDVSVSVRDFIDDTFQGNQRSREEIASDRQAIRAESQQKGQELKESIDQDTGVAAETTRAVVGGVAGAVEGVGETVSLIKDTVTGEAFKDGYEAADWDLGITENKTQVGKFARTMVSMLTVMRGAGAAGVGVGGGASAASRLGTEAARGAIADLIVSQDDENLTNMLEDMGLPHIAALAVNDEDGPWSARIKNIVEGGVFGVAVDGVGELLGAIAKGRAAKKAGMSTEEATNVSIKALQELGDEKLTRQTREVMAEMKGLQAKVDADKAKAAAEFDETLTRQAREVNAEFDELKAKVDSDQAAEQAEAAARQAEIAADPGRQLDLDMSATDRQMSLEDFGLELPKSPEARPGKAQRIADQDQFGSTPTSQPLYEASDAAKRTTEHTPTEAAVSQFKQGNLPQTSAKPMLTDAAFQKIVSPRAAQGMTDDAIAELEDVIIKTASSMDAEALAKELGQSTEETVSQALRAVAEFLGADTTEAGLKALADKGLTFTTKRGQVAEREAVVAVKTLIGDTANQINETAANITDAANTGADATRQVEMLGDRLKALLRLHKTSSVHYGGGLAAFKIGGLSGLFDSSGALAKEIADNDKFIDNMLDLARKGDPKSINDFKNAANGLVLAGGDPGKQLSFWQLARKVGTQEALKSMYSSLLSSPLTHTRNFIGNATAVTLRPISLAIGRGLTGDVQGAKAAMGAFHSFHESIGEAFTMGAAAWKNGVPVGQTGGKYLDQTKEAAKALDQLRATANTTGERAGVFFLTKIHDLNNNPWASYPTRALTAGDEMFKALVTRMEMKRQVFDESFSETGSLKFDPDLYAKKLEEKIGKNGEIVDKQLREVATEVTFQQELSGAMKKFDAVTKAHPALTYLMPFVRTPHNLLVYAGTHAPVINRLFIEEYQTVMKGTDENAKAIMRGREALGWMTVTTGVGMAASGIMTGNGPVDPQKREAWLKTNQPQSIKVGGTWVSYASVEPLNTIFATVVDLVEIAKAGDAAAYDRSMGQLAYTIAAATYNKSYFQGLATAVEAFNPNNLAKEGWVEREMYNALNAFIPLSGARRQMAKAMEPAMLEINNERDRALNTAVPGYAALFGTTKTDIFTGETRMTENENFLNWVLPFSIKGVEDDPVLSTIAEKGIDINTTLKTANGVELDATERSEIDKLTAETGLYKDLDELFKAEWFKEDYQNWVNSKTRPDIKQALWYSETIKRIQDARKRAVDYYRSNNEDFDAKYRAAQMQKYRATKGDYSIPPHIQELLEQSK